MKNLIKRAFRSFGLNVSSVAYARDFLPGLHLIELFRQANIQCVLDVGSNTGQYRDLLRQDVGFRGWVLSFEPVPAHVDILKVRAAKDAHWEIHACALGDFDGVMEINVMKGGDLSSFLSPSERSPSMTLEHRISVPLRSLDSLVSVIEAKCPLHSTYLKLDTQGFDLKVLRGASKVLPQIPALQTELSLRPIYEHQPTFDEVSAFLKSAGFELTGMFPVFRDSLLRLVEFDGVFVNSRLLSGAGLGPGMKFGGER